MTGFRIERLRFNDRTPETMKLDAERRLQNWPVVYVLDDGREVYVGETLNAAKRMEQHRARKRQMTRLKVVLDDRFNKSACLDLESHLIRWFSGDEKFRVINANAGLVDYEYFDRATYRETFDEIFEQLRADGMFTRDVRAIENSDLFKLSPFKALNDAQAAAVENILDSLFDDLGSGGRSTSVIEGGPGTGKTIVAIYLLKLLEDIRSLDPADLYEADERFSEFFVGEKRALLEGRRLGFVIPQQSLRKSVQRVFRRVPGLKRVKVLTPFEVGESADRFDVLIVDEAHRLAQRAAMPAAVLNIRRREITERLFGEDRLDITQLDWIRAQSDHQIFLLDTDQSVRPADLPREVQATLVAEARDAGRHHILWSQMRVAGGNDYVAWVKRLLAGETVARPDFGEYELRMYDDLGRMYDDIRDREAKFGLARLVAGYAWPWQSKADPTAFDIELDGQRLRWNGTSTDWINSTRSFDEVGSIHTVQGYDLNYAGVIIGNDLRYDATAGRTVFDRSNYHDAAGKRNNPVLGLTYSDEDLLAYVRNIYSVLMTRGIRGTFVYVCDPALRERLRPHFA